MNTTMADGARERCVAQIGEALFGQPGLTLMELAEKVKGMRGTPDAQSAALHAAVSAIYFDDNSDYLSALWTVVCSLNPAAGKLLERDPAAAYEATKPGSAATAAQSSPAVRGDALLPCPFCGDTAERIDFGVGSGDNEGGSCVACTGCGSSGPVEFGFKENFLSSWNRRAIAASQPVGQEPAFYLSPSDWGHIRIPMTKHRDVRALRHGFDHGDINLVPFYPAPPAQAVDLGHFKALYRAYVRLLESGRDRITYLGGSCDPVDVMEANDLDLQAARRLIDSKAVGDD